MDAGMLANLLQPALSRDNTAEDDLVNEEGFRVCAVCGETKQAWFEVPGLIPLSKRPRMCRCEREKREAEEAEEKRKKLLERIEFYRVKGLSDSRYRECTFAKDDGADRKASDVCRSYVKDWEWVKENNMGLMMWGDVGGGKTFFAACIANALIDQGVQVVMTTIPQLITNMKRDFEAERGNILHMIANVPLLVLDDVGTERNTEYSNELAYEIINTRYNAKKPLVVTTNLTMKTMKDVEDVTHKRMYERIIEMCSPCKVVSTGRRQQAARSKMEQMMARFGLED